MKLNKVMVGCWVMVQWTDGITTGILIEYDPADKAGVVFNVMEGTVERHVSHSQIIKLGKHVEFNPVALGLKPLK